LFSKVFKSASQFRMFDVGFLEGRKIFFRAIAGATPSLGRAGRGFYVMHLRFAGWIARVSKFSKPLLSFPNEGTALVPPPLKFLSDTYNLE
jgi:hypothetical protein